MKKLCGITALNVILCFLLCACDGKEPVIAESAIEVSSKGEINQTIVESFDKDYYSSDELKAEIEESIAEYDSGERRISLTDVYEENGKVFVTLGYSDYLAAKDFSGSDFFYGTVSEAEDNGYLQGVSLKNIKDDSVSDSGLSDSAKNDHVFITSETGLVYLGSRVLYVSANVEVIDNKKVRISGDSDGLAYIVTK